MGHRDPTDVKNWCAIAVNVRAVRPVERIDLLATRRGGQQRRARRPH